MKKKNERKITIVSCISTAVLVAIFTLSQGEIRFGKKDNYGVQAQSKEEVIKSKPYIIELVIEDEGIYNILAYKNQELSDEEIINLIDEVKNENHDIKDNYIVKIYNDEESVDLTGNSTENLSMIVSSQEDNKIAINKYYSNIESENVKTPMYEQLMIKNVPDKNNALKTKIDIIMESSDSPKEMLSKIKSVGNYTRSLRKTFEILNIVSYTSQEQNEYWEYSGHNKNDIMHGRIIDNE